MPVEIERKFLLAHDGWREGISHSVRLRDGMLAFYDWRKIRIRFYDQKATLTVKGPQPAQTGFEGRLAMRIADLDPARPVVIEAESAMIGRLRLPGGLWQAMRAAPRIAIEAGRAERARYLTRAYADMIADPAALTQAVDRLRPFHPAARIGQWQALIAAGDFAALADGLMEWHYDPGYARSRARIGGQVVPVSAASLAPEALPALAAAIAREVAAMTAG